MNALSIICFFAAGFIAGIYLSKGVYKLCLKTLKLLVKAAEKQMTIYQRQDLIFKLLKSKNDA